MPLQGLVNKWVEISRGNTGGRNSPDLIKLRQKKTPHTELSIKTETCTLDSSPTTGTWITREFKEEAKSSCRMLTRKLNTSNSYSDLLRRKSDMMTKRQNHQPEITKAKELTRDENEDYLAMSPQELFNPLAPCDNLLTPTISHGKELRQSEPGYNSFVKKQTASEEYAYYSASNQSDHDEPVTFDACDKCCESENNLEQYILLTDYFHSLSMNCATCKNCQDALQTALKVASTLEADQDHSATCTNSSTTRTSSGACSYPVPINSSLETDSTHLESIALVESSRKLLEFMNIHKKRIEQITREREEQQNSLSSKLSHLTSMCQEIRQEVSHSNNANGGSKVAAMLMHLEAEMNHLKSSTRLTENVASLESSELIPIKDPILHLTKSTGQFSRRVNSNDKLLLGSSYKSNISCISGSSDESIDGLMFDLDDA